MAYACKTSSARNIVGVIPYLPYCKQSKMRKRGCIVSKLLAKMMCESCLCSLHVCAMFDLSGGGIGLDNQFVYILMGNRHHKGHSQCFVWCPAVNPMLLAPIVREHECIYGNLVCDVIFSMREPLS